LNRNIIDPEALALNHRSESSQFPRSAMLPPLLVFVCVSPALLQSATARGEFDVASIRKPNPSGDRGTNMSTNGGTLIMHNATLQFCIIAAYGVQESLIEGGPAWINSERYEILAKAADSAQNGQLLPMLQSLREDRFKLKVHREARQRPIYTLTVAKNGPKLHPSESGEPFLGRRGLAGGPITGRKASMAGFAATLSGLVGRKVIDQTGLSGVYDFTLEFAPPDVVDSPLPALVTALQEQLGLRLKATSGTVEVLVVDHAEKPIIDY
jgi:uncharacterized protein (TIGR03435 family)